MYTHAHTITNACVCVCTSAITFDMQVALFYKLIISLRRALFHPPVHCNGTAVNAVIGVAVAAAFLGI